MESSEDMSGRRYRADYEEVDEDKQDLSEYETTTDDDDEDEEDDEDDEQGYGQEVKQKTECENDETGEMLTDIRTAPVKWCVCVSIGNEMKGKRRRQTEKGERNDLLDDDYLNDFEGTAMNGMTMNRKRKRQGKNEERHDLLDDDFLEDFEISRGGRCCLCFRTCICCRWWCLLMMMMLSLCALLTVLLWGDDSLQKGVYNTLIMTEGSEKDHIWRTAELEVLYTVRVFNLTNPREFMNGERPRMEELGPYVYIQKEYKENVKYNDDGTKVEYQGRPTYIFQPHLSSGRESDRITTVNIPFVNAADMVKGKKGAKAILQMVKKVYGFSTLRKLTVGELLWGHKSRVLDWARTVQEVPYPHQQFGVLMGLNDTLQKPYLMHTGKRDMSKINKILAWNKHETLDFWYGDICNMIRGTDANGFPPGLSKNDILYIFNGQLCRSLPLVYSTTVTNSDLEAYRFIFPDSMFAYNNGNAENRCYCGPSGCPSRGILDLKPCLFGASVAFSFPHFYKGDPRLRHMVRGLRPDPAKHRTEFDIYPDLGVPLRVKLRMQMNVMLDGTQKLERARHFDLVLPVFWFEVGIDSLPGEVVGLLKLAQNLPPVVKTTSVTLCTALTLIFLLLLLAQTVATWCGWGTSRHARRPLTPEDLPHNTHYRPAPQTWQYEELPKPPRRGDSFASSGKDSPDSVLPTPGLDIPIIDDHTLLPPYRRRSNNDIDTIPSSHEGEYSQDQGVPPPYSPSPEQRSPSTVSVEIHTTASDDDIANLPIDSVPVKTMPLEQQDYHPVADYPAQETQDPERQTQAPDHPVQDPNHPSEETQNPERVTPSTPPPLPGEPVLAPLARVEETSDLDSAPHTSSLLSSDSQDELQYPRPANHTSLPPSSDSQDGHQPRSSPPLATSSPQGSTGKNNQSPLPPPLESDL